MVKHLLNPHMFVQEAANAGVLYEELLEACLCLGKQKVSRMFSGKSIRGGVKHISGVTIDKWLSTFKFASDNANIHDEDTHQVRSIEPTSEWFKYLDLIRLPIGEKEVERWSTLNNQILGNVAESFGMTVGTRNTNSLKTLLPRMQEMVNRRKINIWDKQNRHNTIWNRLRIVTPLCDTQVDNSSISDGMISASTDADTWVSITQDENGEGNAGCTTESQSEYRLDYTTMNIRQLRHECKNRNIPFEKDIKTVLVELLENHDEATNFGQNMEFINDTDYSKLSKTQLHMLCNERGYVLHDKLNKDALIKMLQGKNSEISSFTVKLSDTESIDVPLRDDGYINVTPIYAKFGKEVYEWKRSKAGKLVCETYMKKTGMSIRELLVSTSSGIHTGTFVYPELAVDMCQPISSDIAKQITEWIAGCKMDKNVPKACKMSDMDIEACALESVQHKKENSTGLVLYVAYIGNGLVKIGASNAKSPKLINIQTNPGFEYTQFRLIGSFDISSRKLELKICKTLSDMVYNKQKDVFKPTISLADLLKKIEKTLSENDHVLLVNRLKNQLTKLENELGCTKQRVLELEKR